MKDLTIQNIGKMVGELVGETMLYNGREIVIIDFHLDPVTTLLTLDIEDGPPIKIKADDFYKLTKAPEQLNLSEEDCKLIDDTELLMLDLQETLFDTIEKVQKDPGYVNQANAINSSANSLIEISKIQFVTSGINKKL